MYKELTIGNIAIHCTHNDLYSLNDLHKSAGGEKRHQPSNFMRLDTTQGLIDELNYPSQAAKTQSSSDMRSLIFEQSVGKGKDQGTFVCKELVYAYAMWISPFFTLKVIRAYDEWFSKPGIIRLTGEKKPSLSKQIELGRALVKISRRLEQTVIAKDPWARAQYLAMIKQYCEVTGTECIDPALIGTRIINDPPEVIKFWDTFESINGGQLNLFNHSSCPEQEIAIKLSQIYGHCQTLGISFPAHAILKPLLLKSERYRYASSAPIRSRHWHKTIRCLIFTKD